MNGAIFYGADFEAMQQFQFSRLFKEQPSLIRDINVEVWAGVHS